MISKERPERPVVVVGAGLAGLTCAAELVETGHAVLVLEAEREVGGRVRTERHPEGFLIDRGFQILLTAYPAQRRQIDLAALRPAAFDAGLLVWTGDRLVPLANPFRHPMALARDLTSSVIPLADKLRLARLGAEVLRAPWQSAAQAANERADDRSTAEALRARGFSAAFVDRIARSFWGGIFLDRSLATSEGAFLFTLKMFLLGQGVLPEAGVGALPAALAARLPRSALRLGARVTGLVREGDRVAGVRLGEEMIPAAAVVVAADPPAARELTGLHTIPTEPRGCVTVYLASEGDPGIGKKLIIDGTGQARVVNLAPLSTVQQTYAPPGQALVAAVLLGDEALAADEATLRGWAVADVARMLGQSEADWRVVQIVRLPFALYAQPPGIHRRLPDVATGTFGLFLASDATVDASANGAILSGESAARAVRAAGPRVEGRGPRKEG
ncbi:MAG: FAD-dependent oxidoreductase [Chloroflexia bacterium]|nr:FAD-dependent oxidoreductase [Chloroflexia bacterium]